MPSNMLANEMAAWSHGRVKCLAFSFKHTQMLSNAVERSSGMQFTVREYRRDLMHEHKKQKGSKILNEKAI